MLRDRVSQTAGTALEPHGDADRAELLSLLDLSTQPMGILQAGQLVYGNRALLQMFGADLVQGRQRASEIFAASADRLWQRAQGALTGKQTETPFEIDYRLADGRSGRLLIAGKVASWHGEPAIRFRASEVAAPQYSSMDSLSAESLQRRALTLELTEDAVLFTDPDDIILEANPAAAEMLGMPRDSLIGAFAPDLLYADPALAESVRAQLRRAVAEVGRWQDELTLTLQGRRVTMAITVIPTREDEGPARGHLHFLRDVTEWRRTQTSLRRQAIVMALMDESAIVADTQGVISDANNAVQRMYGYDRGDLIGSAVDLLLQTDAAGAAAMAELRHAIASSGRWTGEVRVRHKHGHHFINAVAVAPFFDLSGAAAGVILICRDVTQQRQQETEREALLAELAAKNTELEQFTYTVSHDLRSPLITVRGFIDLLEQDIAAENPQRVASDLLRIRAAAERMDQMLSELLRLSRVGRVVGNFVAAPLKEVVGEALAAVAGRLLQANVQVEVADPLPVVRGDRLRLVEVFQNLIDNAVKFMGPQPQPLIQIGQRETPAGPIIFVRDNGIGIDPRYHEKIFGLFDTLVPNADSTGIGLAIVKRIVEKHGGRIWVESRGKDTGSTFCLLLPRDMGEE